jgi:peptidoglycan hydrolase-like protein with peptidoglycan-binding domain
VKQLQTILKREGHFDEDITGFFGSLTKEALIAFQKAKGIEPLGIVGPKTRSILNAL